MLAAALPALIGAGASLAGGFLNRSAAQELNAANIANQLAFAKNGIRWRVEDAKKAGVHPLFALGANTSSFSNVTGDTSLGDAVSNMGQDLSRATAAVLNKDERAMQLKGVQLELENKGLQNDILRQELASKAMRIAQGVGPGMDKPEKFTAVKIGGTQLAPDKNWSDSQTGTNRYGEGYDFFGPWILDADLKAKTGKGAIEHGWNILNRTADRDVNSGVLSGQVLGAIGNYLRRQGFTIVPSDAYDRRRRVRDIIVD